MPCEMWWWSTWESGGGERVIVVDDDVQAGGHGGGVGLHGWVAVVTEYKYELTCNTILVGCP